MSECNLLLTAFKLVVCRVYHQLCRPLLHGVAVYCQQGADSNNQCPGLLGLLLVGPSGTRGEAFFSPVHVRLLLSVPFLFQATFQPVSTGLASSTLSYVLLGLWRTAHKRICIGCLCVGKYLHKHSTVIPTLDCTFHHHQNQKMEYLLEEMY